MLVLIVLTGMKVLVINEIRGQALTGVRVKYLLE